MGKLEEAHALFAGGSVEEAVARAREALRIAEAHAEENELIKPMLFLASLLIVQRQHDEAEPLAERAREITERQLASARSRLATTLKYLGAIHTQKGALAEAQAVYERAVEISAETVGRDHPETAKHLGNLAAILLRRERDAEAEAVFAESLAIWDAQESPHPVYAAGDLRNLAELRFRQERPADAVALFERAFELQDEAFGESDPRFRNTLRAFIGALRRAGRDERAGALEARLVAADAEAAKPAEDKAPVRTKGC